LHIKGAQSFKHLKTIRYFPDGSIFYGHEERDDLTVVEYKNFHDTATALGLLQNDQQWQDCLEEASKLKLPRQMRLFFVNILIYNAPIHNATELWNLFSEAMSEDIIRNAFYHNMEISIERAKEIAIAAIGDLLIRCGSNLSEFGILK
jgi:hypothetical protein